MMSNHREREFFMERTLIYTADNSIVSMPVSYFLKQKGFSSQNLVQLKKRPLRCTGKRDPLLYESYTAARRYPDTAYPGRSLFGKDSPGKSAVKYCLRGCGPYGDRQACGNADPPFHEQLLQFPGECLAYYFEQQNCPFVFRCINRLDRDTSGLTIVAKHYVSAGMLSAMIANKATSGITRNILPLQKARCVP